MKTPRAKNATSLQDLEKTPAGIAGLDEITGGGLPKGRPTLVCGNAGCGKTILGIAFLVNGANRYDEPGVFMAFEESGDELTGNVASAAAAQIESLQADLAAADRELKQLEESASSRLRDTARARAELARSRMADDDGARGAANGK